VSIMSPIRIVCSHNPKGTVRAVADLFSWFHKPWETHKSFQHFYTSPSPTMIAFSKPDPEKEPKAWRKWVLRHVAKELPVIGWEKSGAVADKFHTVREMATATKKQWKEIEGIGETIAKKVTHAMGSDVIRIHEEE